MYKRMKRVCILVTVVLLLGGLLGAASIGDRNTSVTVDDLLDVYGVLKDQESRLVEDLVARLELILGQEPALWETDADFTQRLAAEMSAEEAAHEMAQRGLDGLRMALGMQLASYRGDLVPQLIPVLGYVHRVLEVIPEGMAGVLGLVKSGVESLSQQEGIAAAMLSAGEFDRNRRMWPVTVSFVDGELYGFRYGYEIDLGCSGDLRRTIEEFDSALRWGKLTVEGRWMVKFSSEDKEAHVQVVDLTVTNLLTGERFVEDVDPLEGSLLIDEDILYTDYLRPGATITDAALSRTLYLYNWTYYTPESVIEKFEKEYGVKVFLDYFASNEDMFAKLKAGRSWYDIVFPSQDYTSIMITEDMLLPIDKSKIPNLQYISPLVLDKATYDPDMSWSVPYFMGAPGIAVNKTKAPAGYARDWSIFADTRMDGRMSMLDDMREVMGDALAHLGYSVNTTNDAELAQAQKLINEQWKPNLVKFDAEGFAKSFSSGEFWVVQGYAEAVFEELEENRWDEVDFFLPPEGGPMYLDSMVIPKGARNVELAHQFIDFIHRPEIYAEFLDRFHFPASVHTKAAELMTVEPFYQGENLVNYELKNDVGADLEKYNEIWLTIRYLDYSGTTYGF